MFIARSPANRAARRDLHLVRAERRAFAGSAELDPEQHDQIATYVADLARGGSRDIGGSALGHSYGEMARALIGATVGGDEPVDLLVLAFAVHDARPGRQTAAFLSSVTPGAPMAFAICDQGSAAAFSGIRIARGYAASAEVRRALVVVVEQAALPYSCPVPLPVRHQGVALLFADDGAKGRVVGVRQRPNVSPGDVAAVAASQLAELAGDRPDVTVVLGESLAGAWTAPGAKQVRTGPAGQPSTGVWWGLVDELTGEPGLVVTADYDPDLRYLCLTALES